MRKLDLKSKTLTEDNCFIIAEIGSNHQGDPDLCERMIYEAANCGADAVKLQKRDVNMFTKTMQRTPYANENSFGPDYGAHREALDWFGWKEFERMKAAAMKAGVMFSATPFDEAQAVFLHNLGVDFWKIDSARAKTNRPFVKFVASFQEPMVISCGAMTLDEIDRLADELSPINHNYALLHCISKYPADDADLQIAFIETLRDLYPLRLIGFSCHHEGIDPVKYARCFGAAVFEVHFTLRRASKGTDNAFSLEPNGLRKLCEDLPRVRTMIGDGGRLVLEDEILGFPAKMGSGVYLSRPLQAGSVISFEDVVIKSPVAGGFTANERDAVIGRELIADCATGINLTKDWLK